MSTTWSLAGCLASVLQAAACTAQASEKASTVGDQKPNILLILADDLRPDCIGALGNPHIQTPNLDRLVERGVSFRNCLVMGSNQPGVCTPSRTMLMTGRNLFNIPLDPGRRDNQPSVQVDFQILRAAGYDTFYMGKGGNTYNPGCRAADRCEFFSEVFTPKNKDICPDKVIAYLREPERTQRPFYIQFAITPPHDPLNPAPEDLALYQGDKLPPLAANATGCHAAFAGFKLRDTDCRGFGVRGLPMVTSQTAPEQMRQALAAYYAVITGYDKQIGRILDELDRTGLASNTLVIFSSDNGLSFSDHGLIHKQSLYESDSRVPLIIRGPGIPSGQTRDTFVYLSDLLPTLLDLAAVAVPATIEAKSFAASVKDPAHIHRQSLYTAYRQEIRSFRDAEYKLILYNVCYSGARYTQLFNLKMDPGETKNLANDPEQAERLKRMIAQARQAGRDLGEEYSGKDPIRNILRGQMRFWEIWEKRHELRPDEVQNFPAAYEIKSSPSEWGG